MDAGDHILDLLGPLLKLAVIEPVGTMVRGRRSRNGYHLP